MQLPDVKFYLFGMGSRRKFLYRDGTLFDALTGKTVRRWQVAKETILPSQYTVRLKTSDGQTIILTEDEQAVWLQDGLKRLPLAEGPINLPKFKDHPNASLLRVLLHEILINIVDSKPVPNFLVYSKPWHRDAAMVAMCLEKTNNLHLIRPWILKLDEPFDRNNAGNREPDNLGQVLYLISLVSDSSHPLVDKVLRMIPQFLKGRHLVGPTDFSEHPVYQTKWLKFGLRALGLKDNYEIPAVFDSYSALFWMDFKDAHVPGSAFSKGAKKNYPYLVWAEAHFLGWPPPMSLDEQYPLTWEAHASQADYAGMKLISREYVDRRICAPHSWHAAEMFLFLLDADIRRGPTADGRKGYVAYDWPQFRGPNRDGKSAETGLMKKWPEAGPKLLWSVEALGIGFSSVAIAGGFVYTTGMIDGEGFLFAYDLEGNLKWKESYGPEWTRSYKGTRTTPTVDGERVYVFSGTGVMVCFNAGTGEKVWQVDTLTKFDGKNIRWGMSGSPLIDGRKVYCTPGGKKGTIVALDKMTGQTIWATTGLDESAAYSSPILIEKGPNRLLINIIQKSVICVNADNGKLIWREPYVTPSDTGGVTPVYKDGCVYVTSAVEREFTRGGVMFQLSTDGTSVTEKWNDQTLDCGHGGVVLVDGYLYGSTFDGIPKGDWVCLDWDSGKVMYETRWNGNKGSIIYADSMLYCYDENTGDVVLVKPSPENFEIVSSFRITQGSGKHWAHPAISDGRLYIRHGYALMAYDIKNK